MYLKQLDVALHTSCQLIPSIANLPVHSPRFLSLLDFTVSVSYVFSVVQG